ncbi:hypothetical protein [Arthrobacter sp. StoSoilB22]|uniref:hypothetical protein n=1 Tax=Arthrobacter sp. StoSoilB22 TaxID=2830996 RepID=UPI001CC3C7A7|nr:hypothetical protein [Arthrobacter sp. StoSoilB22]
MAEIYSADLFDSALDDIDLDLQLGGREAGPPDIATRILATLEILERLDPRPMEWVGIPRSGGATLEHEKVGRTIEELGTLVMAGARKDDAERFHPSWGYFVQLISFLKGSDRAVSPFHAAVSDGAHGGFSSDSFSLTFADALVSGREAVVSSFSALIEVWQPTRGGVFGYEVSRLHRGEPAWYPPVGVLTYFAEDSGYVLPDNPLVELRRLRSGVMAILNDWTLDAVLAYGEAFRAVNDGIPRRAAGTG